MSTLIQISRIEMIREIDKFHCEIHLSSSSNIQPMVFEASYKKIRNIIEERLSLVLTLN